mmetsp:Transcript_7000/g.14429  ORF Transcript_7000/g.14429 Transcript_7000/m.14429 type:complete len:302 (+) Transcript_7000:161-1066(+)
MAGRETRASAKKSTHRVGVDSTSNNSMSSNQSTTFKAGSDMSNGGPRVAAALLSLGQDLTNGEVSALVPREPSAGPERVQNPLETVTDIPMIHQVGQKKRKRSEFKDEEEDNGNPPDFWHWLPPGEKVGNWDVLCGRGGESNHYIGNKKYRKYIGERKDDYRKIDVKQRKQKTDFVRAIVQHIKNCGGRFIDVTFDGKYYVVTDEKARKKTSQALRETKTLKWLVESYDDDGKEEANKKKVVRNKDVVCPFCKEKGHKTRIAKACLRHHEWLDINSSTFTKEAMSGIQNTGTDNKGSMLVV